MQIQPTRTNWIERPTEYTESAKAREAGTPGAHTEDEQNQQAGARGGKMGVQTLGNFLPKTRAIPIECFSERCNMGSYDLCRSTQTVALCRPTQHLGQLDEAQPFEIRLMNETKDHLHRLVQAFVQETMVQDCISLRLHS